jgi:hypothetical protein
MKAIIFIFLMVSTLVFSQPVTIQKEKIDLKFKTLYSSDGDTLKIAQEELAILVNAYRKSNGLSEVKITKRLWIWSHNQSLYLANLVRIGLIEGNIKGAYSQKLIMDTIVDLHAQDYDLPNYEEQDRTQIPLKIRPFVGENVFFMIIKNQQSTINQKQLAKLILDAWKNSKKHNDLLLYEKFNTDYRGTFDRISVSIFKTRQFTFKKDGKITNSYIISATISLGIF